MKQTVNVFILLLLGFGLVGGCGEGESDSPSANESASPSTNESDNPSTGVSQVVGIEYSADEARRYEAASGDYSYIMPQGWQVSQFLDQYASGETVDGYTPSIGVREETFSGTLEEYHSYVIQVLEQGIMKFKHLRSETITTDAGQEVIKIVVDNGKWWEIDYILEANGDRKYIIGGGTRVRTNDSRAVCEQLLDAVIKTFRVE